MVMMDWPMGWGMGLGIIGVLFSIAFWVAIIFLIVWGVNKLIKHESSGRIEKQSPVDFAKERYARGEITKEEFEQLKKDLA
jgi:putative membrane protein